MGLGWRLMAVFALPVLLAGCSGLFGDGGISVVQTGASGQLQAVPEGTDPEDEVIGRREHPRILAAYGGVYSDRRAEIMIARIAGRLMTAADQPDTKLTVTILDTPDVNAFALPGGYIYVTRGILALANDASELAAVLAHEIAHVTLKHARARSNRVRTSEIVDRVITGIFGGDIETDQTAARSRLNMAAFNQAQELAADKEGVIYAGRAGYDPRAAARFLAAMGRFQGFASGADSQADDFLSSHPSTPDRIEKAIESANVFAYSAPLRTERESYLAAIDGLQFGDNPDQGAIMGDRFIHPRLGFTFAVPKSYQLQNTTSAVVGVAGDGEAVRFDSADVPKQMALTDYLQAGWIAGLKPETVRAHSHDGIEMASGEAATEQWAFRVTALRFNDEVYRFIFAARADTDAFKRAAEATVRSFRATQASDLSKIRKAVVRIVKARPGETTESLAARMGRLENARELFLVLNNLYTGDPIVGGQGYKIIAIE